MRLKPAGFPYKAHRVQFLNELVAQRRGNFRRGRIDEARPAAFAAIGVESELRYDEHLAARVHRRQIEFALRIRKDAQVGNFVGEKINLSLAVARADAKEDY